MNKKVISFLSLVGDYITKIKNFIVKIKDEREENPTTGTPTFITLLTLVSVLMLIMWLGIWFPFVDKESARWALSAQVQAMAAIFGLMIAAMAFRWRVVTNQEQQLRNNIYSYLKRIGTTKNETVIPSSFFIIDLAYEKYLAWINEKIDKKQKIDKKVFINLGKLWVIKELSFIHSSGGAKEFGRCLKYGQTKQLSKVSKLSRESAINTWENYYRYPAQFTLDMYETLAYIYTTLFGLEKIDSDVYRAKGSVGQNFDLLISIVSQILSDGSKLIAEEIKRRRSTLSPFYFASGVLILAIVVGLLVLTGVSDNNLLLNQNSDTIRWVVGIPVGLSVYGVFLCFDFVRRIWS